MIVYAAWTCIVAPLIGTCITPLLARQSLQSARLGAVSFSCIAALAALCLLPSLTDGQMLPLQSEIEWLDYPIDLGFGLLIDPLSIVLTNVVAVVSFIIMVYCLGYMGSNSNQVRFWMWMNGFITSMLLLVLSNNLLFMFVGWKLVGVCSYGLIGYYYQDQRSYWIGGPSPTHFVTPSQASLKALVVTGVGDMFMLGGILILYFYAGTLNFVELYATAPEWLAVMAERSGMILLVSVLLLAGPIGKSAQFPLHEWLPEAMAGPGPVSALIHAATMVKSGIYFVARLVPLFYMGRWVVGIEEASWFFQIAAWVGGFTALLAATQGIVAVELKKILAYSTVSQIGYMMMALGVAGLGPGLLIDGYTSGIFHLVSHALFKACLFLCAGTVIHAVHAIYIHDMGSLKRWLPLTWLLTLVSSLSLMGLPPFPGFWSKDAVLLVTLEANRPLFMLALTTVGLTALYTVRLLATVFYGHPSQSVKKVLAPQNTRTDGTLSMRVAVIFLGILIVVAGLGGPLLETTLHTSFEANNLGFALSQTAESYNADKSHVLVSVLALLFLLAGGIPGYYFYNHTRSSLDTLFKQSPALVATHRFLWNRWWIDRFYTVVFVDGTTRIAAWITRSLESRWNNWVHDQMPRAFTENAERLIRRLRTDTEELLYNVSYVLVLFLLMLIMFIFRPV